MQFAKSPRKRCAVCVVNGLQMLFLVVPRTVVPPVSVEPEPLMFFDELFPPTKKETTKEKKAVITSQWSAGSVVIPLVVNSNGEIERHRDFRTSEFSTLKEAYDALGPFEYVVEYPALFGCLLLDKVYILVATKVEEAASLPFGGSILRVLETEWVPFNIPGAAPLRVTPTDRTRLKEFQRYSYERGYFYSDDVDLMKPFPFASSSVNEVPEFYCDWSKQLRQPFRLHDVSHGCSILIRGYAEGKNVHLQGGSILHLLLIGRQNNLNPGPRYLGRGLNGNNAVGNDHIYEYIMWKQNDDKSFSFAKHTILRGTIPVHWQTRINATISEPSMIFSPNKDDVLRGSDRYFESVLRQLATLIKYDSGDSSIKTGPFLRCINLLRQNPQSNEGVLARYFVEAVRKSDTAIRSIFPNGHLDLVHVDWLNLVKDYGIDVATKTLWECSLTFLAPENCDALLTIGCIHPDGSVTRSAYQNRFVRVNCADSLDRTNLGCFFTSFQVSIVMLQSLGISLGSFLDQKQLPSLDGQEDFYNDGFSSFSLPLAGTKTVLPKPFVNSWFEARNPSIYPVAVGRVLSELYVYNGDVVAQLYTNSAAMHGNILRGICGLKATASNMVIATQRMFENVFEDAKKFRIVELLLGRNKDIHFPSMSKVFLTRPVPIEKWKCALIALGVPPTVTLPELEDSVRRAWDELVLPKLPSAGFPSIPSSALCFTVSAEEDEVESYNEFVTAVSQIAFEKPPPTEEDISLPQQHEQIAIIQFDSDLCAAMDVPKLLLANAMLRIKDSNVILAQYGYPIQGIEGDSSGIVQKAASSLKTGLKKFVRGLNN
ncbi:synaptojanin (N-terminal domain) [Trypanosoma theileri]|uniref:Synaptojanin (N-terminal domain) n=1 Tax=Trypanosoma theileri TaxID=67003 RepID=A0A1X0NNZ9_9TRYP|nr:synaptojanin (N-terminal domain) [Trypanosoma theileri]ORC86223.1 synaptojanin (N-terminal domain) [Trypanosoma theileri]